MKRMRLHLTIAILATIGATTPFSAASQTFPATTVKIVVPFPAGGGVDSVARLIAERLSTEWKESVIVENRAGANGNVGAEYVARSQADGHTILFSPSGVYATAKLLYKNLKFDPDQDLKPVMLVASTPNVVLLTPKINVKDARSFFNYARARPGELAFASQGAGSTAHLTMALLAQHAGLVLKHVPYRGAAPAMNDVVAGHVALTVDGLSSALGLIQGGNVQALFVASKARAASVPGIPTAAEVGLDDFESESWYGIAVPSATPDNTVMRLNNSILKVLNDTFVRRTLEERGARVIGSTPAEMAAYMRDDSARWRKVIEAQKIEIAN